MTRTVKRSKRDSVATGSKKFREKIWKTDWLWGLTVFVAVLGLHVFSNFTANLDTAFFDFSSTSTGKKPGDKVAVIAIDDASVRNIGRWPWPREVQAKLIDQLAQAQAKVIVNTVLLYEPSTDRGLAHINKIKDLAASPDYAGQSLVDGVVKLAGEAQADLDGDSKLAASIKRAGNVLLASTFEMGEPQGRPDKAVPDFVARNMLNDPDGFSFASKSIEYPIEKFGLVAKGIGHLNQNGDTADGVVRRELGLVGHFGQAMPSLALLAAATSLNLTVADIKADAANQAIRLSKLTLKTDEAAQVLPQFYAKTDFPRDSFFDVYSGKIAPSRYAGKVVVIGATAAGIGTIFPTPSDKAMAPVDEIAHVTSAILQQHQFTQPSWAVWVSIVVSLLILGYLIVLLPRLSATMGAAISGALFVVLLVTQFGLIVGASTWIGLVLPAFLLLVGHIALTTKRFWFTEVGKERADSESADTNRMMGLALQGQGRLDEAFDRFRRVPYDEQHGNALMDNMNNLALDFERKRQFNKAQAVYEVMAANDKDYKGLQAKLNRAKNLSETVILGGGGSHPGGTLLLDGGAVEKPMLGRYQVEKELGKGAMGVVYLGKDPKIGRVVAIKTMALSQEFEGEELDDARQRFFREAETAGRLQHPYIVTIYDAGEEHDLAYIAMEFLRGKDLVDFSKGDALLPMDVVVSICARVAEALAYAHTLSVVHRDIKPANIMYERASDTVKVTDFGIARITDSSKTKTGLVLGTPSFMSPEQIAGKKVDGRSDLYSLGVMLFQMLAGVLPFRGDSMAELMYKISNEEAPDIRIIRAEIPVALANVVALSLSKRVETRYQDGVQFAADLRAAMTGVAATTRLVAAAAAAVQPQTSVAASLGNDDKTVVIQVAPPAHERTVVDATAVRSFAGTVPFTSPHGRPQAGVGDNPANSQLNQVLGSSADPFEKTIISSPRKPAEPEA